MHKQEENAKSPNIMNRISHISILILLCIGCGDSNKIDQEIKEQINQLKTLQDKESYLTEIFEEDQRVRQSNDELVIVNHGEESKEYKDYVNTQLNTDALNLKKVEYYLSRFDHPSKSDSMNYKAESAIWAVIQHSNADARERNFEHLYKAQLKGDFDLSWILSRMYQMRKGKSFQMPKNSKYDNEVDQLIFELGLEEKKINIIQEINR